MPAVLPSLQHFITNLFSMSLQQKLLSEFLATTFLVLFGNSSVANELLPKTKSSLSLGFGFISLCWGIGASISIICFGKISASMNPAMSLADFILNRISLTELLLFSLFQILGGCFGSCLVYLNYYSHYQIDCVPETVVDVIIHRDFLSQTKVDFYTPPGHKSNPSPELESFKQECNLQQSLRLMTFCTKPAIPNLYNNFISECLGTVILVIGVNLISLHLDSDLKPLMIGLYIFILIATMGGTTGYGCNPARDLGPRIIHYLVKIKGKGGSEFLYGGLVVLSNLVGGILGAVIVGELVKALK